MSDANLRQIRVLHIVSAGALASSLQQSLFMPLLTRLPRPRVKSLVACLSPGAVPSAVLRQSGVPTYDLALSRKRFSPRAFQELQQATRNFRPDVIQAWGHTAQIIAALLRPRCEWKPQLIWNISDTAPIAKNAGLVDRQKLKYAAKFASRADRIVYSSEAAAAAHQRVGFPEGGHETIPPGVDATRFKPDFAARRKLREQLSLPGETFVIGMYAPFQPEYDFSTLLRGVGELIKTNPNVALVLAGHGVQKGNAPLMALIGGGALSTRVHLLGEWSDISALYNACDVVCSSATNDQSRMNVVMAMLCGVPCVATGIGAQGEVIGQHGVAIEAGNPSAFVKGLTRVMQMTPEKRTFMAQGARKHALANYVYVRSLQKYLQLYYDLIGRQSLVTQDLPAPDVDPTLTVPPALPTEAEINAAKRKPVAVADWGDPDSLESKVTEREPEELPKWRIEQEQERAKREAELAAQVAATKSNGDVLQVFEAQNATAAPIATPMTERARGVADDSEELLSADLLTAEVPILPRAAAGPSSSKKNSNATPVATPPPGDAAKQAALRAARLAALQPIATAPKRASAVKPTAAAKAAAGVAAAASVAHAAAEPTLDFLSTQPVLLAASELLQPTPASVKAEKADTSATQRVETLSKAAVSPAPTEARVDASSSATLLRPQLRAEQPSPALHADTAPRELLPDLALFPAQAPVTDVPLPQAVAASVASTSEQHAARSAERMNVSSKTESSSPAEIVAAPRSIASTPEKVATRPTPSTDLAPALDSSSRMRTLADTPPVAPVREKAAGASTRPQFELSLADDAPVKSEPAASPLGRLAKALASASVPAVASATAATSTASPSAPAAAAPSAVSPAIPAAAVASVASPATPAAAVRSAVSPATPAALGTFAASSVTTAASDTTNPARAESRPSVGNIQPTVKSATSDAKRAPTPSLGPKPSPARAATSDVKQTTAATSSMTAALEKWNSSFDLGELSLMATGVWAAAPRSNAKSEKKDLPADELSGAEALSLISEPAEQTIASTDPTLKLEALPDPATKPKLAVNGP